MACGDVLDSSGVQRRMRRLVGRRSAKGNGVKLVPCVVVVVVVGLPIRPSNPRNGPGVNLAVQCAPSIASIIPFWWTGSLGRTKPV